MEFYCEMKVNDKATGELLEKVSMATGCDECETAEEFIKSHKDDCVEFLKNKLEYEYDEDFYVIRFDMVKLNDDFDENDEEESDEEAKTREVIE